MSLELIQISDVDLPAQWLSDLSSIHTQMEHVSQFLRDQASRGIRYGSNDEASGMLRDVAECADVAISYMEDDGGVFPAWVENIVSVCSKHMKTIWKLLKNSITEGKVYGSYSEPVPGDAGAVALYRGRADGIEGVRKNPYSPNNFQHKIYEQGFSEGYGRSHVRFGSIKSAGSYATRLEWMMPPNRMTEPHRMTMMHRQFAPPGPRLPANKKRNK